uniref:Alanyl-tRNA synthetase domain containing 1 n=1 Tax=Astyanax mexicanus TaxID=7994 RepID=A0A3B1JBU9_ASTMX
MAFQCQRDSYMKQFVTAVVSCSPAELKLENNGKKEKVKGFNVLLKDTILFPEGGGQPDDHGTIENVPVLRVTRQGPEAVHFISSPVEEGQEVQLKLDWERRFDHMQQHSGERLNVCMCVYKHCMGDLGRQRSSIELDTAAVKAGEMEALEAAVNEKIREHVPVNVQLLSLDDPAVEKVRSRGLPDDHAGPIRIIDIEGVDANMCCGTHVSNLSHLQVIKILGTEKGKKNKTNLMFIAGNRVLKYAEKSYSTERSLTALLKKVWIAVLPLGWNVIYFTVACLLVFTLQSNLTLLRDMAVLIAQNFKNQPDRGNFFSLHKCVSILLLYPDTVIFLTVGEEKGAGLFLLAGPENVITQLAPRVSELLQGKGAAKNGRFQGKANSLSKRAEVETLLQEHLPHHSAGEE